MPIVQRYDATGIPSNPENPKLKYGMAMVGQQQKADQEMRLRAQDAQYDMERIGAMQQYQSMREPSIGEESMIMDQEIRNGMYSPDVVKALRKEERDARLVLRDRDLNSTQQAQALQGIQSRMRLIRSTGKLQPTVQEQPPAQAQPMPLQQKPRMTASDYFSDPKNYDAARAQAIAQLEGSDTPATEDNIHRQMHNNYLARQKFLEGLQPQPQGQVPQAPGDSVPASPQQTAPAPAGPPQASYSAPTAFGAPTVLAQGGFQQNGLASYNPGMNTDPKGVAAQLESYPPKFRLNDGSVVGSVLKNGQWVPETQSSFVGETGGQATGSQVGQAAYQPTGDYSVPPVYGASPVLANAAQAPQQQSAQYPMEAVSNMQYDPNATAPRDSTGTNSRKWTSADGKFSTSGKIVGVNKPTEEGGFSTVRIQRDDNGSIVDVPMNRLSQQDQIFVLSKGNRNTMYAMQNPQMSPAQAYLDPNNPVRQEESAADQSIVNPQKQSLWQPGGTYGLGVHDRGISPYTGMPVIADIVPGAVNAVPRDREPTPEEKARDKAAKDRFMEWRESQPGYEVQAALLETQKRGENLPALTQLLGTMTTSQRRDYTKWLMEEPSRYAMRNEIAQQQLDQMKAAKESGKLETYPGMQARKPQQGNAPVQGRPMQGQPPQATPPAAQGQGQAPQAPMQGQATQAPMQGQPPQAPPQGQARITRDDPRVALAIEAANNPNASDDLAKWAAGVIASAGVSREEVEKAKVASPAAQAQNSQGSVQNKSQHSTQDIRMAYDALKLGKGGTRADREKKKQILRDAGYPEDKIKDLALNYKGWENPPPRDASSNIRWAEEVLKRGDTSQHDAARKVLEKEGYTQQQIDLLLEQNTTQTGQDKTATGASPGLKYPEATPPEAESEASAPPASESASQSAKTEAPQYLPRNWDDVIGGLSSPQAKEVMQEMQAFAQTLEPDYARDLRDFLDDKTPEDERKAALKRLGDKGIKVAEVLNRAKEKAKRRMNNGGKYPTLPPPSIRRFESSKGLDV